MDQRAKGLRRKGCVDGELFVSWGFLLAVDGGFSGFGVNGDVVVQVQGGTLRQEGILARYISPHPNNGQ